MLVIQASWWFLVFAIGGIFSDELDPECFTLGPDFDGVASPNQSICIFVTSSANFIHFNITKKTTPGVLFVKNSICNNGLLDVTSFAIKDGEYMDFKVYLPWFTNKNCTLGDAGDMRMVFKSDSEPIEFSVINMLTPHLKSKMVDGHENENETKEKSKDLRTEIRTPRGKFGMIITKQSASDVAEEHAEHRRHTIIMIIAMIAVGFLLAINVHFYLTFFEYKFKDHRCPREMEANPIEIINRTEGYDFSFLADDDWDQYNLFVGYDEDLDNLESCPENYEYSYDSDDNEEFDTSAHSENSDDYEDHTEDVRPYYMDTLDDSGCHVSKLYEL